MWWFKGSSPPRYRSCHSGWPYRITTRHGDWDAQVAMLATGSSSSTESSSKQCIPHILEHWRCLEHSKAPIHQRNWRRQTKPALLKHHSFWSIWRTFQKTNQTSLVLSLKAGETRKGERKLAKPVSAKQERSFWNQEVETSLVLSFWKKKERKRISF